MERDQRPEEPQTIYDPSLTVLDEPASAIAREIAVEPEIDRHFKVAPIHNFDERTTGSPETNTRRTTARRTRAERHQRNEILGTIAITGAVTFVALMLALASNCG